jgi:hypothetical protein
VSRRTIVIDLFRKVEAGLAGLAGWPDTLLTVALLAVSGAGTAVALFGPRSVKALVLAWFLFP